MIRGFQSCALVLLLSLSTSASAVILYRTPNRNTSPPKGKLATSGWQYQFRWGDFLGTPISKKHFITAGHIGGRVGQGLTYNGRALKTTAFWDDPRSDLRIWKINGGFSSWAPIYTGGNEAGKRVIVFGRGTQRGSAVYQNGQLKGWREGYGDHAKSWGENTIVAPWRGNKSEGDLLRFDFSRKGLYNEAALTNGDSGGGVFINDRGVWKLAGINYSASGPFSYDAGGSPYKNGFDAALFDMGGLYRGDAGYWQFVQDTSWDNPTNGLATRISSNAQWIRSVLRGKLSPNAGSAALSASSRNVVPEPGGFGLLAAGVVWTCMKRRKNGHRNRTEIPRLQ